MPPTLEAQEEAFPEEIPDPEPQVPYESTKGPYNTTRGVPVTDKIYIPPAHEPGTSVSVRVYGGRGGRQLTLSSGSIEESTPAYSYEQTLRIYPGSGGTWDLTLTPHESEGFSGVYVDV